MNTNGTVTIVGAGSAAFGPAVLGGLIRHPGLGGLELRLHDIDGAALDRSGAFARGLAGLHAPDMKISISTDPEASLDGADIVVLSIARDRERTWARDRDIAREHGIQHYAENGGPGAIFHTARNLQEILPLLRIMERCCPQAWLLNYTNPVPRICTAVNAASSIRSIGICHQLGFGYFMAAVLLADAIGLEAPRDPHFRWNDASLRMLHEMETAGEQGLRIVASGLNHFTWGHRVERRSDGKDLYPLLRERNRTFDRTFEPLTREVFDLFGIYPTPGDCHLVEYLPFTHNPSRGTWDRYDIQMYDFAWAEAGRRRQARQLEEMVRTGDFSPARKLASERAETIVHALLGGGEALDEALNVPNRGQVPGLPEGAIVETPVRIFRDGLEAVPCPPMPEPVLELCRRQALITKLSVEGLIEGDDGKLRQALALDPMVDDPALPERLLAAWQAENTCALPV